MHHLPKTGTKTRSLLEFVARHNGVRFTDMQKFLCELSGVDWEKREAVPNWKFNNTRGVYEKVGTRTMRVNRGWWCTNLTSGRDCICRKYLAKKNGLWYINEDVATLMRGLSNSMGKSGVIYSVGAVHSSLEANLKPDTIHGSSDTCAVPPASKVIGDYATDITSTQHAVPSPVRQLKFAAAPVLPQGPTIPAGNFVEVKQELQMDSDAQLIQALRAARADVAAKEAALNESVKRMEAIEQQVRKALAL